MEPDSRAITEPAPATPESAGTEPARRATPANRIGYAGKRLLDGVWPGWRLDFVGCVGAVVMLCLSLTPSLLPRPWYLQGLVSGVLTAAGYLLGVGCGHLVYWLTRRHLGDRHRRIAWQLLWCTTAVLVPVFLVLSALWQQQIHTLMRTPRPPLAYSLATPPEAVAIFLGLVLVARSIVAAGRTLHRFLGRWVPALVIARLLAVVGTFALVIALFQGVVANGLMSVTNTAFKARNGQTPNGAVPPVVPEVSGGPGSLVPWNTLGRYGRAFVSGGPTVDRLSRFSGRTATQPIRVYVGVKSAPSIRAEAALAVRELKRTGAFSRKVLCVITTTGMGWVDRDYVEPLEYMYNGETAQVAVQYSYLPSVVSFVVDRDRAQAAGRELFNQVYSEWSKLPRESRPKLLVFGESLGAFGAESAFSGIADIRNRTDGMLLVGPPNNSPLWSEFTAARDSGTREVLPTYQAGRTVRFAARPSDLTAPRVPWTEPRVVYLQHASDPVVWWSPRLILHKPDWLEERRGRDVDPTFRWYPIVTFAQLSADMVLSIKAPPGHGHSYDGAAVDAWAQIAPPAGWNAARTRALNLLINGHS